MKLRFLLVLVVAAASLGACRKTVNTVERAEPLATPQVVEDKRVVYDKGLNKIVRVTGVREQTVSENILKIQVDVQNVTKKAKHFSYRFEFFDLDGIIVSSPSSVYKSVHIEGKETMSLTAVAPTPRAKDFKLKLIESKQ